MQCCTYQPYSLPQARLETQKGSQSYIFHTNKRSLRPFIELNIETADLPRPTLRKVLLKLMNNSVYGKEGKNCDKCAEKRRREWENKHEQVLERQRRVREKQKSKNEKYILELESKIKEYQNREKARERADKYFI